MLHRLGQRDGREADAPSLQLAERRDAALVPIGDLVDVAGVVPEADPFPRAPPGGPRLAKHVLRAPIACPQLRRHQDAVPETQPLQVVLDRHEVRVVQLRREHAEEPPEALGPDVAGMRVGDPPQPLEAGDQQLEDLDRLAQQRVREASPVEVGPLLGFGRLRGNRVDLPGDFGLRHAIGQELLAIADGIRRIEAGEDRRPGHAEQEPVASCHRPEQRVEPQVLGEGGRARGWVRVDVEIPVAVHQERFHGVMRAFTRA